MTRPIPGCLAALRSDLDLRYARGRPTGVARLVLVLLLLHANEHMEAWPGVERLAKLTRSYPTTVSKALRLLAERGAIERVTSIARGKPAWRIRLNGDFSVRPRMFWPGPQGGDDGPRTVAIRALARALGNRTYVAVIVMLYQFARQPEIADLADDHPARRPRAPNQTWIARVLGTSASTVRLAKRECLERGLATQHERGLLVFEDPTRWPEILGCADLLPRQDPPPRSPVRVAPVLRLRTEIGARHLPMHGRQR